MTTRQAGADQLFGSYPSRADFSGSPELDDLLCFLSCHRYLDMTRDSIRCGNQRGVDFVDVSFRHATTGMAHECLDRREREAQILGCRTERVAQAMRRQARDGVVDDTGKRLGQADIALGLICQRREDVLGFGLLAGLLQNGDSRRSDRSDALASLAIAQPKRAAGEINFCLHKPLDLSSTASSESDSSRDQDRLPVHRIGLGRRELLPKRSVPSIIEAPFPRFVLWPDDPACWVVGPIALAHSVGQDPAKQAHRAGRSALPTGDDGAAALLGFDIGGGLAADHVLLETANISMRQILDGALAQEWDDMTVNPPLVGVEGRSALGLSAPRQDQAALRLIEIFPAKLLDRHGAALELLALRRIGSLQDVSQTDLGGLAGFLDRQDAIAPHRESSAPAVGVAILNEKGFGPTFLHPEAKSRQLVVPNENVRTGSCGGVDNAFRDLDHLTLGKHRVSRER